ncbi:MAG: YcjF family protein [Eubacteriaceae bacterium]|nr:YcjF family protein [Eubacteriaceae bacterium]
MDNTGKSIKNFFMILGFGLLLLLILAAFNQTVQIVNFMTAIHPFLGKLTLAVLAVTFGLIILVPFAAIIKFSKMTELPEDTSSPAYHDYMNQLKVRLHKNTILKTAGFEFDDAEDTSLEIDRALSLLNEKSRSVIKDNAAAVFLTTAISQNGVLDGAFVLASITKMIWQIARIYDQRPSLNRMLVLYGNIGATVLMARGIEDLDLMDEQIEPIITSVLGGGLANLIPGAVTVTNLIVNSITEGSVNALLTLRVGCLTKMYCSSTTKPNKSKLRRSATIEACSLLGSLMKENTVIVLKAFGLAAKRAAKNTLKIKS